MKNTIDLLTIEEAKKLPVEILQCKTPKDFNGYINDGNGDCCWWLRSPGCNSFYAAYMLSVGAFNGIGYNVNFVKHAVRPALRIGESLLNTLPRTKKGYVVYLDTKWIDISDYLGYPCLLKKKCMKEAHRFDGKSNNYDQSEIKDFLKKWYEKKLKKYYAEEDENVLGKLEKYECNKEYENGKSDGMEMCEKYYQEGLNDAWKAAKRICSTDFTIGRDCFGAFYLNEIFEYNTAKEAIDKIKAYDEKQKKKLK